jgi:putative membrane protein
MKIRHLLVWVALMDLGGCGLASGASEPSGKAPRSEVLFLERAAKAGLTEVAFSQVALDQLKDPEAKSFAETMIAEPTPAIADLTSLAAKKQVTLPDQDKAIRDAAEQWARTSKDLDLDYVDKMVADHLASIALFDRAAKSRDPEIAAFAGKTLPTLYHHLDMIQAIKRTFRKD